MAMRLCLGLTILACLVLCASAKPTAAGRKLLYEQRISGPTTYETWGTDEYSKRQMGAALVGGVMMIVAVVAAIIWGVAGCLGRCGYCKGNCAQCFFCMSQGNTRRGYPKKKRAMLGIMLIVALVMLVAAAVVFFMGGAKISSGLDTQLQTLYDECIDNLDLYDQVNATMYKTGAGYVNSSAYDLSVQACDDIQTQQAVYKSGESLLNIVIYLYWALAILLPLIFGLMAFCCGSRCGAIALVIASWVMMIVSWFVFAVAVYNAVWKDDMCMQWQNWYDCHYSPLLGNWSNNPQCRPPTWTDVDGTEYTGGYNTLDGLVTSGDSPLTGGVSSLCPMMDIGDNTSYWNSKFATAWEQLYTTVDTYNTAGLTPSFGIKFYPPGSTESASPMKCGDSAGEGESCVFANQSWRYPNVVHLRQYYYNTEGAHYDSTARSCDSTWTDPTDNSTTQLRSAFYNASCMCCEEYSTYDVRVLGDYNQYYQNCTSDQCYCSENVTLYTESGSDAGNLASDLTQLCKERAILTSVDALWLFANMDPSNCKYVTNAAETILEAGESCDSTGDGFVFAFSSIGYAAVMNIILVMVGYLGVNIWDPTKYEENVLARTKEDDLTSVYTNEIQLENKTYDDVQ